MNINLEELLEEVNRIRTLADTASKMAASLQNKLITIANEQTKKEDN